MITNYHDRFAHVHTIEMKKINLGLRGKISQPHCRRHSFVWLSICLFTSWHKHSGLFSWFLITVTICFCVWRPRAAHVLHSRTSILWTLLVQRHYIRFRFFYFGNLVYHKIVRKSLLEYYLFLLLGQQPIWTEKNLP